MWLLHVVGYAVAACGLFFASKHYLKTRKAGGTTEDPIWSRWWFLVPIVLAVAISVVFQHVRQHQVVDGMRKSRVGAMVDAQLVAWVAGDSPAQGAAVAAERKAHAARLTTRNLLNAAALGLLAIALAQFIATFAGLCRWWRCWLAGATLLGLVITLIGWNGTLPGFDASWTPFSDGQLEAFALKKQGERLPHGNKTSQAAEKIRNYLAGDEPAEENNRPIGHAEMVQAVVPALTDVIKSSDAVAKTKRLSLLKKNIADHVAKMAESNDREVMGKHGRAVYALLETLTTQHTWTESDRAWRTTTGSALAQVLLRPLALTSRVADPYIGTAPLLTVLLPYLEKLVIVPATQTSSPAGLLPEADVVELVTAAEKALSSAETEAQARGMARFLRIVSQGRDPDIEDSVFDHLLGKLGVKESAPPRPGDQTGDAASGIGTTEASNAARRIRSNTPAGQHFELYPRCPTRAEFCDSARSVNTWVFSVAMLALAAMASILMRTERRDLGAVRRDMQAVRTTMYVTSALLVMGVLAFDAALGWLTAPQEAMLRAQEAGEAKAFSPYLEEAADRIASVRATGTMYKGLHFVALLALAYVPCIWILRQRADLEAPPGARIKEPRIELRVLKSLSRVVALLAPFLAGPVSTLIEGLL